MSVKEIKEPGKKPPKDKKPPREKPDSDSNSPWKVNDAGERVRNTRALPHEIRLRETFAEAAALLKTVDGFSGTLLEAKGEELAYGYAKLAKEDPRVKRVLDRILEGSAWSAAMAPTISLVICIGWHYGMIPTKVGVPMVLANGMMPVTREQEINYRRDAEREQAEAQAQAERNGQGGSGD